MSQYTSGKNEVLAGASVAVVASVTSTVSNPIALLRDGATAGIRVSVKCSAVTAGSGISAKLQHSISPGETFSDIDATNAAVAITAAGWFDIPLSPSDTNDGAKFPLRPWVRLVVVTLADAAITVDDVRVCQSY